MVGVLGTLLLAGGVLLTSGEDWGTFVNVVFVAHLPLALLEAGIVGLMVGFLARVQPELLGAGPAGAGAGVAARPAAGAGLRVGAPHGGRGAGRCRRSERSSVECWYETGDAPAGATARVTRPDGGVLAEGPIDAKGFFRFRYEEAEALRVEVNAPGGHRAVVRLTAKQLGGTDAGEETPAHSHESQGGNRWGDLLAGVGFVLAAGAFWLGLRNARGDSKASVTTDCRHAICFEGEADLSPPRRNNMKITILADLYDDGTCDPAVDQVAKALRQGKHTVSKLLVPPDGLKAMVAGLARRKPELVFHMINDFGGASGLISTAAVLDAMELAYTGGGPGELFIRGNKLLAKKILAYDKVKCPVRRLHQGVRPGDGRQPAHAADRQAGRARRLHRHQRQRPRPHRR